MEFTEISKIVKKWGMLKKWVKKNEDGVYGNLYYIGYIVTFG